MSEEQKEGGWAREAYDWLQILVGALIAIVLVFTFLGRITPVEGSSMVPTLQHGDVMLVRSAGYTPRAGDVVVLTKAFDAAKGPIVKRVVATGGQTVEIDYGAGLVYVDGAPLDEPYILEDMREPWYGGLTHVTVPEGSVFVMGDNRNGSNDSRDETLGPVDQRCILGKVELVLFPFQDFGVVS